MVGLGWFLQPSADCQGVIILVLGKYSTKIFENFHPLQSIPVLDQKLLPERAASAGITTTSYHSIFAPPPPYNLLKCSGGVRRDRLTFNTGCNTCISLQSMGSQPSSGWLSLETALCPLLLCEYIERDFLLAIHCSGMKNGF